MSSVENQMWKFWHYLPKWSHTQLLPLDQAYPIQFASFNQFHTVLYPSPLFVSKYSFPLYISDFRAPDQEAEVHVNPAINAYV